MLEFHIARQQIEQEMTHQFRETPERDDRDATERNGVVTTTRARLSAALHAVATAIAPATAPPVGTPSLKH